MNERLILADSLGFLGFQMGEVWKAHPDLCLDVLHTTSVPPVAMSADKMLKIHWDFAEKVKAQKDKLTFVKSIEDILFDGTTAVVCGLQLPPPPRDMKLLPEFKKQGIHIMAIAYSGKNEYGGGSAAPDEPLSDLGKEFLLRVRDAEIALDLSHAGIATVTDILAADVPELEMCVTHSGVSDAYVHPRNLPIVVVMEMIARQTYFGIPVVPWMLSEDQDDLDAFRAHAETVQRIFWEISFDHMGIGTDLVYWPNPQYARDREARMKEAFDPTGAFKVRWPNVPLSLQQSVNKIADIVEYLKSVGWSHESIENACGQSFVRFLRRIL